jgi:hypothetical protein
VHRPFAFSRKQALEPVPLRPAAVLAGKSELLARTLGAPRASAGHGQG